MIRSLLLILFLFNTTGSFRQEQKAYARVRDAYAVKEKKLEELFSGKELDLHASEIFLRVHKLEKELELWARKKGAVQYKLIKTFDICNVSGVPGPKRMIGDLQTPEGFYTIDRFNPTSSYYLSLGIDYPNSCDRHTCKAADPGGDIFIHGKCVTIGCMPITDDFIKELYVIAVEARNAGQTKIPVAIFPCRMNSLTFQSLLKQTKAEETKLFWNNIKEGYDLFEKESVFPRVIQVDGKYKFTKG
jgi:murein L,D-transpeptidase YafK